jgi:hypothetical protein
MCDRSKTGEELQRVLKLGRGVLSILWQREFEMPILLPATVYQWLQ